MRSSSDSALPRRLDQTLLSAGIAASLCLCVQATNPLIGSRSAPAWFNVACSVALLVFLARFIGGRARDERWIATACLGTTLLFMIQVQPWTVESAQEFASQTSRFLSTTTGGFSAIALIHAWSIVGLALLCGRATQKTFASDGPLIRATAWLVGLVVVVFGVKALIGYASGSSSLFAL